MSGPVFHAGEIALQQRTGVHTQLAPRAALFVREQMPEQHIELFSKLPTLQVGSLDTEGQPWASLLVGPPGFVQAPDARHLHIAALPDVNDPLRAGLRVGQPLGLLGLEPATRRRNRMNGTVVDIDAGGFTVQVDQSFGNCPQYIQARAPRWVESAPTAPLAPLVGGALLEGAARVLVAAADTLFIASAAPGARGHGGAQGVDVSHRGGKPGFVRIDEVGDHTVLTLPDFRGNFMFNTLGNLALRPEAGLLFVDPARGDLLQLAARAEVVWDGALLRSFAGAQRLLVLQVQRWLWRPGASPLRWSAPVSAPQLADTGHW